MLTAWRLLVAASAATGVVLASIQYAIWWTALSQLASVAVAVTWLGLAVIGSSRPAPRVPWLRGALAAVMMLVSVAFLAMQHGNVLDHYSVFEHLLTPALVVADYLLIGRSRVVPWWHPLTWALVPLPYLGWYVVGDLRVYAALDTAHPLAFGSDVGVLLALVLVAGFTLRAVHTRRVPALALALPDTI